MTDIPIGNRVRARRVGLRLTADELAARAGVPASHLLRAEGGRPMPKEWWLPICDELVCELGRTVDTFLAAGLRWQDIRVQGWSTNEIRDAALTSMAGA